MVGQLDWNILVDIFAGFYDFFMRIGTALTYTPQWILNDWSFGNGVWSWSFFNPFTGFTTSTSISHSILGETFLNILSNLGFGYMPLWQGILTLTSTFFFVVILAKVIGNLFG